MKKILFTSIITLFITSGSFAQNLRNASVSFDPLTFIGIVWVVGSDSEEPGVTDFNNLWFGMDINWETERQKEMGVGIFLASHKVFLKTQYRTYHNREKLCGFFWGLYGLIEWRRMYWLYDDDNELTIGWDFPVTERENVYHSLGITGGLDIGYRHRKNNFGVTPYMGLGIPLFFYLGSLPNKNDTGEFDVINIALRAIHIGLKLDLFGD